MFRFNKIDDFDLENKVVGLRIDINSPIIDGKVVMNPRIKSHCETILKLIEKKAKIVILAHQGRFGKSDCVSLKEHLKLISLEIKKKIDFLDNFDLDLMKKKIDNLKKSQILILENLRFLEDEIDFKKKDNLILKFEKFFDFYVLDAFSVSHREQTSIVGFSKIPLIAGVVMQREILGLNNILSVKRPLTYVFGGAKPDDLVNILETNLKKKKVDNVILTGVIGELALICKGFNLGCKYDFLKEKGYLNCLDKIKFLINKYKNIFVLPKDLALFDGEKRIEIDVEKLFLKKNQDLLKKYLVKDIGSKTINFAKVILKNSSSIYFKGPAGDFGNKVFSFGTLNIIKAILNSKAYSFMGGGHSVSCVEQFSDLSKFSYVSLAGGALVKFLSSQDLPGVLALEKSFDKNFQKFEDFVVVGSNTLDLGVNVPFEFSHFHLGDKIKILEDFKTTIGGGGVNVSICLSRLGAKVGFLSKMSFETCSKVEEVLKRDKVRILKSKISKKPAAKSILIDTKDTDRIILTYRGQNSDLNFSDFDFEEILSNNFYFSSLSDNSFNTQLMIAKKIKLKNKNSLICYNLSSYLIENQKGIKSLLKFCDVLILNLEEAQSFSNKSLVSDCLKFLKNYVLKLVVITNGANGAFCFDGKKEYFVKSYKPKKIVDTTGAGDCFGGTFFYFFSKNFGILKSLELASKNCASVISYKGSHDGLLYYEDLKKI